MTQYWRHGMAWHGTWQYEEYIRKCLFLEMQKRKRIKLRKIQEEAYSIGKSNFFQIERERVELKLRNIKYLYFRLSEFPCKELTR